MGSEAITHTLHDEIEMVWATGLDIPLTDGFDLPLFSQEEWLFDFGEFVFLEERIPFFAQ